MAGACFSTGSPVARIVYGIQWTAQATTRFGGQLQIYRQLLTNRNGNSPHVGKMSFIKRFVPKEGTLIAAKRRAHVSARPCVTACKCLKGTQLAGRHHQNPAPEKGAITTLGVKSKLKICR